MSENKFSANSKNSGCSWLGWSPAGPHLAIGSCQGNLLIFNKNTLKKEPIIQKHTRKITCGAWSNMNLLALGGEDKIISVSTAEGDTKDQTMVKEVPSKVLCANQNCQRNPNTFSVVVGGKRLLIHSPKMEGSESEVSVELAFQAKYEDIVDHMWYPGGFVLVGFMTGKFSYWKEIRSDRTYVQPDSAKVCQMHWSKDGQLFTVGLDNGSIVTYLTKVGTLAAACHSRLAYLTSLRELTIVDVAHETSKVTITTDIEPSFVALGPVHA